jgi:GT2 family glycosyltransferase
MENDIKNKKIAIILPVVNCLNYTKQFIKSLPKNIEFDLIIINNGSTDGTIGYLSSLCSRMKVNIINSPYNLGVAKAWNLGINRAIEYFNSEYFFIPNNDIIIRPETIPILIETLDAPDVLLSTAYNINDGKILPISIKTLLTPKDKVLNENPDFSCFMIKKETIEKVGFFDEKFYPAYFEDNDYHYRINLIGSKAVKNLQNIYFHFGSMTVKNDEYTRALSNAAYRQNEAYFIKKWGGKPGQETFKIPFNE